MITKWQYVRASFLAAAGTILALMSGFLLVAVWIPVINPGMFRLRTGETGYPTGVYIVGTVTCVGLIALGKIGSDRSLRIVNQYKGQNKKTDAPNNTSEGICR